jgi:DNA-binding MarR family transcriptional regulator
MLNSNTLTPLLKRLEHLNFIRRIRSTTDERVVNISLTDAGAQLKQRCACIPQALSDALDYPLESATSLKASLDEFIRKLQAVATQPSPKPSPAQEPERE